MPDTTAKRREATSSATAVNGPAPDESPHLDWTATRTWLRSVNTPAAIRSERVVLEDMRRMIAEPEPANGRAKESFPLYSIASFRDGYRDRDHVEAVYAVVLDDDAAHFGLDRVVKDMRELGVRAYIHTSFSTDDEAPTWRVIIPLARPVSADEHDPLHALIRARLAERDHEIPAGAIDAARCWYVPVDRQVDGRRYRYAEVDGDLLDPDAIAAEAEEAWRAHRARASTDEARETRAKAASGRPGDEWASVTSWSGVIANHGWRLERNRGDVGYWVRPGKRSGPSATTNYAGTDLLHVFSDAAPPFEPHHNYSKFTAFTLLEHRGDFVAAAQALAKRGYGRPSGKSDGSKDGKSDGSKADRPVPKPRLLSEVQVEDVEWLWEGRIPFAKVTVLEGNPDEGKSTLALDLAARVTKGTAMPLAADETKRDPAGVVIVTAEDGAADTVRPRLEAAGGDPKKVKAFDFETGWPEVPDDLLVLEDAIRSIDAKLVIVDPFVAVLADRIDSHRDHTLRRAVAPLAALAARTGVAIIVIRHLNKGGGSDPKMRGGGSIALTAAARSVMLCAPHPEDENVKVLARVKGNLAAPWKSIAYKLEVPEGGKHPRIAWGETVDLDARALLTPQAGEGGEPSGGGPAIRKAIDFLRKALAEKERPSTEIEEEANASGISERTLRRARKELGVEYRPVASLGGGKRWLLSLPPATPADKVTDVKVANHLDTLPAGQVGHPSPDADPKWAKVANSASGQGVQTVGQQRSADEQADSSATPLDPDDATEGEA